MKVHLRIFPNSQTTHKTKAFALKHAQFLSQNLIPEANILTKKASERMLVFSYP
jgi:hypothetical protein